MKINILVTILINSLLFMQFSMPLESKELNLHAFINSSNGLVLRSEPNLNSKKILVIPYRSIVVIQQYSENVDTINGIKAQWAKIKFDNSSGWVFSGYLQVGNPPTVFEENIRSFIQNPFSFSFISNDKSKNMLDSIISTFKKPKEDEVITIENKHKPDIEDKIYVLKYDGLMIRFYHSSYNNKDILGRIDITGNKYKLKNDISIGSSRAHIESIFDKPHKVDGDECIYYCGDDSKNHVIFYYAKDKIEKISILYTGD